MIKPYENTYDKENHYSRIIYDKDYFLGAFKNLIYKEVKKNRYDIHNYDDFEDLVSQSYIILIDLFNKLKIILEQNHANKTDLDKTKILQAFIRNSYPGRLFNWWCDWRALKYIPAKQKGNRGTYKQMVYRYNIDTINTDDLFDDSYDFDFKVDEYRYVEINLENIDLLINEKKIYVKKDELMENTIYLEDIAIEYANRQILWDVARIIFTLDEYKIFYMYFKKNYKPDIISIVFNVSEDLINRAISVLVEKIKVRFNR